MSDHEFARRNFLKGVGVSMALPWLESLRVWGDESAQAVKASSEAPVRLVVLFSGNGFQSDEWWARGAGKEMELGKVLLQTEGAEMVVRKLELQPLPEVLP